MATTEHLSEAAAIETLSDCVECQHYLRHRVHDFWREKRKRSQKPALRRLQAPTPEADANPYLVFRQRAKPNKPLTRRRRETQEESLEKINLILRNLEHVVKIAAMVREREASKSYLTVRPPSPSCPAITSGEVFRCFVIISFRCRNAPFVYSDPRDDQALAQACMS